MRAIRKVLKMAEHPEQVLSQSNAKNKDGGKWCGRTSACIIYNYYARFGVFPGPIKNRSDKAPYQLVYSNGQDLAGLTADGQCAPGEVFDRLKKAGLGAWDYVSLYPKALRGSWDIEAVFGPLLDHLDRNNPAFFASGFSESETYASHFITITGYRFQKGGLWLRITDPATNLKVVKGLLKKAGYTDERVKEVVENENDGLWATPGSTKTPYGSQYWVRDEVFRVANTKLDNHPLMVKAGYPHPLLCDNSFHAGFSVVIDTTGLVTDDRFAETELAAGWPIMPPPPPKKETPAEPPPEPKKKKGKSANAAPKPVEAAETIEQRGLWAGVLDAGAPYPVGSAMTWHGGVHVAASAAAMRLVYSMGPGEIVLARFRADEPSSPPPPKPSNGFVLVRHRIDTKRRVLIAPDGDCEAPLDAYSLYMHTGPLGAFLEQDPDQQGMWVLRRDDPNAPVPGWLSSFCPAHLPPPRTYLPATADRVLCVHPDLKSADQADGWKALPLKAEGRIGADLDLGQDDKGAPTLAGSPVVKAKVGGVDHYVLPAGGSPNAAGARALQVAAPMLGAASKVSYYNRLTGEVIHTNLPVARGAPIRFDEQAQAVRPIAIDGKAVMANGKVLAPLPYGAPGMVNHAPGMIEGDQLRIFKRVVRLHTGDPATATTLSPGEHKLFFEWDGDRPKLAAVVVADAKQHTAWQAAAAKSQSIVVPADQVKAFNTVSEETLPLNVSPTAALAFSVAETHGKRRLVSTPSPNGFLVQVTGVTIALEHDPEETGVLGARAVFFETKTPKIVLYAQSVSKGAEAPRTLVPASRFEVKNADAMLAFALSAAPENAFDPDRPTVQCGGVWLDLEACVAVSEAELEGWNRQLATGDRMKKVRERLSSGQSCLMGVKLDKANKSGWKLDAKDSGELLIKTADRAKSEPADRPRYFCEVDVQGGGLSLREVKPSTAHSPWEVAVTGGDSMLALTTIRDKDGAIRGAVFELLLGTPCSQAIDDSKDGGKIDVARKQNKSRDGDVTGYRKGAIFVPPKDARCRVTRTVIAAFDGDFMHLEVFAEKNPIAPDVKGEKEKLQRIPTTPFSVYLDDDPRDDYSPTFVQDLVPKLTALGTLDVEPLKGSLGTGNGVITPDEWDTFCRRNIERLSLIVTAHATEWHPDQTKALDHVGKPVARGMGLPPASVEEAKREIKRLAFLDQLKGGPKPGAPLYHVHPFRFVEWMLTGVNAVVIGKPDATLSLEYGSSEVTKVDLVKDPSGGEDSPARVTHRARAMLSDGAHISWVPGILTLSGFDTTQPRLPMRVRRSSTANLTIVNPRVIARGESDTRADLDTAIGAVVDPGVKDGYLLADGGKLPNHQLSYARAAVDVEFNWLPPTKITAKLSSTAFQLRAVAGESSFTVTGSTATFEPPQPAKGVPRLFSGAQKITLYVDVLPSDKAGETGTVEFEVEGGDFPGTTKASFSVKTRKEITQGTTGEDVAKLQLYLSQIPDSDGLPCYRYTGQVRDKNNHQTAVEAAEYAGKGVVLIDGVYKRGLARALWRFVHRFASELTFDSVKLSSGSSVQVKGLTNTAQREGQACVDFPIVDADFVAAIVTHFVPPYVMPRVDMRVEEGTGKVNLEDLTNIRVADGWKSTDLARSALLPSADDSVSILVGMPSLATFGGSVTVDLELGGGAYDFATPGDAHLAFPVEGAATAGYRRVELKYSKNPSTTAEQNTLKAKVTAKGHDYVLGALQLAGSRDLGAVPKDGTAKRDAAIVQALLVSRGRYVPPGSAPPVVAVDGKWTPGWQKALNDFGSLEDLLKTPE